MSAKKAKKSRAQGDVCSGCRNYRSREGKKRGFCTRKEKKRGPTEEACGHFEPV